MAGPTQHRAAPERGSRRAASTGSNLARLRGLAVALCFLTAELVLTRPQLPLGPNGYREGATIYPWWTWVLVGLGVVAGLVIALEPASARAQRLVASATIVVAGAQLTGTGLVAAKHWRPAFGMGGYAGDPDRLEQLAILLAVAAAAATLVGLRQLWVDGAFSDPVRPEARRACLVAGLAVVVVLPLALTFTFGDADMRDLTSWGAMGLIYAGPWGLSIVLAGRVTRPASVTMLAMVALSASMALVGPQMIDLVFGSFRAAFGVVLLLTLGLMVVSLRAAQPLPPGEQGRHLQ